MALFGLFGSRKLDLYEGLLTAGGRDTALIRGGARSVDDFYALCAKFMEENEQGAPLAVLEWIGAILSRNSWVDGTEAIDGAVPSARGVLAVTTYLDGVAVHAWNTVPKEWPASVLHEYLVEWASFSHPVSIEFRVDAPDERAARDLLDLALARGRISQRERKAVEEVARRGGAPETRLIGASSSSEPGVNRVVALRSGAVVHDSADPAPGVPRARPEAAPSERPNREALMRGVDRYRDAMRAFVLDSLAASGVAPVPSLQADAVRKALDADGSKRFDRDLERNGGDMEATLDVGHMPPVVQAHWSGCFGERVGSNRESMTTRMRAVVAARNEAAHPGRTDLDAVFVRRSLKGMVQLLREVGAGGDADYIEADVLRAIGPE